MQTNTDLHGYLFLAENELFVQRLLHTDVLFDAVQVVPRDHVLHAVRHRAADAFVAQARQVLFGRLLLLAFTTEPTFRLLALVARPVTAVQTVADASQATVLLVATGC